MSKSTLGHDKNRQATFRQRQSLCKLPKLSGYTTLAVMLKLPASASRSILSGIRAPNSGATDVLGLFCWKWDCHAVLQSLGSMPTYSRRKLLFVDVGLHGRFMGHSSCK